MGGRHFLPFHLRPHLLFDTDAPSSGASSSSWERWPFLLALVALGGPCIPRLGRGQRGQDLPPQEQEGIRESCCNFRHIRSVSLTFLQKFLTPENWFGSGVVLGNFGQHLMNGVPGVDGDFFDQNSLLICSSFFGTRHTAYLLSRGKTRLAGKKFLTAVERKRELQLNPENNIFSPKATTASLSIS